MLFFGVGGGVGAVNFGWMWSMMMVEGGRGIDRAKGEGAWGSDGDWF